MPIGNLKLTSLDKKILHSYCQTLDGLSNYLGNGYEIVLHSLEDYEQSQIFYLKHKLTPIKTKTYTTQPAISLNFTLLFSL